MRTRSNRPFVAGFAEALYPAFPLLLCCLVIQQALRADPDPVGARRGIALFLTMYSQGFGSGTWGGFVLRCEDGSFEAFGFQRDAPSGDIPAGVADYHRRRLSQQDGEHLVHELRLLAAHWTRTCFQARDIGAGTGGLVFLADPSGTRETEWRAAYVTAGIGDMHPEPNVEWVNRVSVLLSETASNGEWITQAEFAQAAELALQPLEARLPEFGDCRLTVGELVAHARVAAGSSPEEVYRSAEAGVRVGALHTMGFERIELGAHTHIGLLEAAMDDPSPDCRQFASMYLHRCVDDPPEVQRRLRDHAARRMSLEDSAKAMETTWVLHRLISVRLGIEDEHDSAGWLVTSKHPDIRILGLIELPDDPQNPGEPAPNGERMRRVWKSDPDRRVRRCAAALLFKWWCKHPVPSEETALWKADALTMARDPKETDALRKLAVDALVIGLPDPEIVETIVGLALADSRWVRENLVNLFVTEHMIIPDDVQEDFTTWWFANRDKMKWDPDRRVYFVGH